MYLWHWESDLLYITNSDYAHEYEIKLTHSDFRADSNKVDKHERFKQDSPNKPKHFWYVCPEGVIPLEEVPSYAGLIYITDFNFSSYRYFDIVQAVKIIKKSPILKSDKISQGRMLLLLKKGLSRYWDNINREKIK